MMVTVKSIVVYGANRIQFVLWLYWPLTVFYRSDVR